MTGRMLPRMVFRCAVGEELYEAGKKETKIYPNDPCPCGSGKKYKNAVVGGKHMITREKLKKLNKENLIELILEMSELLTENLTENIIRLWLDI